MKLTSKGRYAVMALVDLARFDTINPVSLRDISLRQGNIPRLFRANFFKTKKKSNCEKYKRNPRWICFVKKTK